MPKTSAFVLAALIVGSFSVPVLAWVYGQEFYVMAGGYVEEAPWQPLVILAIGTIFLVKQSVYGLVFFLFVLMFLLPATLFLCVDGRSPVLNGVMSAHLIVTIAYTWSLRVHFH